MPWAPCALFWSTYKVTGYRTTASFQAGIQELRTRAVSGHFRQALPIAPDQAPPLDLAAKHSREVKD